MAITRYYKPGDSSVYVGIDTANPNYQAEISRLAGSGWTTSPTGSAPTTGGNTGSGTSGSQSSNYTPSIPYTPAPKTPSTQTQTYTPANYTPATPAPAPTGGTGGSTYTVQPGDTLSKIAAKLGVPVSSITGYRSGNPNLIYAGEVLKYAGGTPSGSTSDTTSGQSGYDVFGLYNKLTGNNAVSGLGIGGSGLLTESGNFGRISNSSPNGALSTNWNISNASAKAPTGVTDPLAGYTIGPSMLNAEGKYEDVALSKSGQYYKVGNDVKRASDNVTISEDEFRRLGLNFALLPDRTAKGGTAGSGGNFQIPGGADVTGGGNGVGKTDTESEYSSRLDELIANALNNSGNNAGGDLYGIDYTGEDQETKVRADEAKAAYDAFVESDPFLGKSISDIRNGYVESLGLNALRAKRNQVQAQLDAYQGVFDVLTDEVINDPDFLRSVKERRLKFLDDRQLRETKVLQREMERVVAEISDKEKLLTDYMSDTMSEYSIYKDRRDVLMREYERLQGRADDASDDARTSLGLLLQNPELTKNITDSEIQFIQKNGYFPISLVKKAGAGTGLDIQTIFYTEAGANQKGIYAVTKDGQVKLLDTVTDIESNGSGGLGDNTATMLSADIARYQNALRAVLEDPSSSDAAKTAAASSLLGELLTKYATSNTAMGIIKESFQNIPTIGQQLSGIGQGASLDAFNSDLSSELNNVNSGLFGKGGRAQRSQERLLAKYPQYTSTIKAAFAPYM